MVAAVPFLLPGRHRRPATVGSAVLLAVWAIIGMASVSLFYLPSAALAVVAAFRARPR